MRGSRRTSARWLGLICLVMVLASCAYTQEMVGRVAGASLSSNPLAVDRMTDRTSDVFFGSNTKGPYTLSWKPINRYSEQVWVDGRVMQRSLDYDLDYSTGVLAFQGPVHSRSMVRVEYSCDFSEAVQNRAGVQMPLSLDLLKRGDTGLRFTALYKQGDPKSSAAPDLAVVGVSGGTKSKMGELNTMFLSSPGTGQNDDASFGDRSALKLAGSTSTDQLRLSTNYLRVGEGFAGAKEYGLQQGLEAMDYSAVFTPSNTLNISSSMKRTENLSGEKKGETNSTSAHKITVTPDGAPRLTVSRTEVEKEKPGTSGKLVTTDQVELSHNFSPNLSAVAGHENRTTETGGSVSRSTTDTVALNARPNDKTSVSTRFTEKNTTESGAERVLDMGMEVEASKTLTVAAGMRRADSEKSGREDSELLSLSARPSERVRVEMSLERQDTDAYGGQLSHSVRMITKPAEKVNLELGISGRNAERPDDESARMMKLSTTALRNTTLHLDWSEKDSEARGEEKYTGVRMETSPLQMVKFSGAYGQKETAGNLEHRREARLELTPLQETNLMGAYKEVEKNGDTVSRTTELKASTRPVGFMGITGGYKAREYAGKDNLDSLDLAVNLRPGRLISFTGAYSENPEDGNGIVQFYNSQTLGLESDLGRLKLRGAYTLKDEYLAGRQREVTEFGANYRLSTYSQLSTSYKEEEYLDSSLYETSIYALTYTHRVGSTLNLYLSGRATLYERDKMMMKDQADYQAEARFGIRF